MHASALSAARRKVIQSYIYVAGISVEGLERKPGVHRYTAPHSAARVRYVHTDVQPGIVVKREEACR